jgi:hypothetical protein
MLDHDQFHASVLGLFLSRRAAITLIGIGNLDVKSCGVLNTFGQLGDLATAADCAESMPAFDANPRLGYSYAIAPI